MIIICRKSTIILISITVSLIFLILFPNLVLSPEINLPKMPTILLDPGHGGYDGGTHDDNGLLEKDIVLDFAYRLKAELKKHKFTVYLTRTADRELSKFAPYQGTRQRTDLLARVQMVKHYDADLMISLHVNAAHDPRLCGAIVFYQRRSIESKKLARHLQQSIKGIQPYNSQKILANNFYILDHSSVPTVLIELAFITNWREHADLQKPEYLQKMAECLASSLYQYTVDQQYKPTFFHRIFKK